MLVTTHTHNELTAQANIANLIATFIEQLDVKPVSRSVYSRSLKQFFTWVEAKSYQLTALTRTQILQYKEDLLAGGKSGLTVAAYINAVRQFYTWAEAEKLYPNIAAQVKAPKRKKEFRKHGLHPAQVKELLGYAAQHYTTRDRAIVEVLLRTGLRTIEISRANVADLTYLEGKRVLKVHGKGRSEKDNFVVLTEKTYQPVAEYLATRRITSANEPLFISTSNNSAGNRLTTRTISQIAKDSLAAIGINLPSFTAHSFRHTAALAILRAGGTLEDVQFTLRHTNPATTQIYTAALEQERRLANSGEALIDNLY